MHTMCTLLHLIAPYCTLFHLIAAFRAKSCVLIAPFGVQFHFHYTLSGRIHIIIAAYRARFTHPASQIITYWAMDRLEMTIRAPRGEEPTGTDAEACAYLYTAGLTAPMNHGQRNGVILPGISVKISLYRSIRTRW